jgi:hypothetical protein
VVENNIASALILEDDTDWDIRIKSQMKTFAKASRILVQPMRDAADEYLDPTYPHPQEGQEHGDFSLDNLERTREPTSSPYGDLERWDMLWVGHCGWVVPEYELLGRRLG